jgi:hypothetical protein
MSRPYEEHGFCDACGKRSYLTRKLARRGLRKYHQSDKGSSASGKSGHKRPYQCPAGTGMWHIGQVPDIVVRRGIIAADAIHDSSYRRRTS